MRDDRDVAIVTLVLITVTCLTILFLKLTAPTGGLVDGTHLIAPDRRSVPAPQLTAVSTAQRTSEVKHLE